MTMHLAQGLSTINTKKRKTKITKAKMAELELRWREHNKSMKQRGLHDMRYATLDEYIDYCYGRIKKPDPRDYKTFKPNKPQHSWRAEQDRLHREKYPSMPITGADTGGGRKVEPMKYTGDLIEGIATMHKSNAVPVMKGTNQAKDIARMRRG